MCIQLSLYFVLDALSRYVVQVMDKWSGYGVQLRPMLAALENDGDMEEAVMESKDFGTVLLCLRNIAFFNFV